MTGPRRDHPSGYRSAQSLWTSVSDRMRTVAADTGLTVSNLQRQFVYHRFLARMFASSEGGWVLKGGTALLARVRNARHTTDIDLQRTASDLDAAVAELRAASEVDLGDYFRFVITGQPVLLPDRTTQPGTQVARIRVEAYVGARSLSSFNVDIVVGALITTEPERSAPNPPVVVDGLVTPEHYLLYPIVDHVADKLCAIVETHGATKAPSSRVRDLVDLVVIARTQSMHGGLLRMAIESERQRRGLDPITVFTTPAGWQAGYAKAARDVAQCSEHRTYAAAMQLVGVFLEPVLAGATGTAMWQPTTARWSEDWDSGR